MQFSNFDIGSVTPAVVTRAARQLQSYRGDVLRVVSEQDATSSEYSLAYVAQQSLHDQLDELAKTFKGISDLVVVGIGGSNLGTAAVHEVLGQQKVRLHQLDTIAPYQIEALLKDLRRIKKVQKLAVCVVSKSGGTAETVVNAGILLDALEQQYKKAIYSQTIFIGNPGTDFMKAGKRLGVHCVAMPEIVGGRYSVATEVGLVPLKLLGHDVDAFMGGVLDATSPEFESVVVEHAARLRHYLQKNYHHYNFFAFEPRLATLGAWYRQLQAESLGKAIDRAGKPVKKAFVPTVATAVELHSVGQLYFSGVAPTYTDFVVFDDVEIDYKIPKNGIAKKYGTFTAQEVATGMYGGVVQAFQEKDLPYRSTIFDDGNLAYSLGLFMAMRMLETMYVAELLDLNAFDQPNVELYKDKTRAILGI